MSGLVEDGNPQTRPLAAGRLRLRGARSLALLFLLFSELLYLTLRFDTEILDGTSTWWSWLLRQTPFALQAGVAVSATLLVFCGSEYKTRLEGFFVALNRPNRFWPLYTILHLAALGVFVQLTSLVAAHPENLAALPSFWFGIWVITGALVFLCWLLALLPWTAWRTALRQSKSVVLAGIAVGMAAVALGLLAQSLSPWLTASTFSAVDWLLRLLGEAPVSSAQTTVISVQNFAVSIAPECSGLEGLGLVSVFLLVYLWTSRRALRFPQALWLFPIGWSLIWIANTIRIAALIWIGAHQSRQLALGGFHSQAGWIAFNAVGLGIVAATQKARLFTVEWERSRTMSATRSSANPASPYLVPFLALLVTGMVLQATTTQPPNWYPVRFAVMLGCLTYYSKSLPRPSLRGAPVAIGIGTAAGVLWLLLMPAASRLSGNASIFAPSGLSGLGIGLWWAARLTGYLLLVPIVEEMTFRGYLIRRLIQPDFEAVSFKTFSWFALIASSIIFGLMHGQLWLPGILAGLLFGLALYRRGNLADAIIAHASANGLIVIIAAATGRWYLLS